MSTGFRIPREKAIKGANNIIEYISPYCERIEIAGSLRREKVDVGDIEIVCIPKSKNDLLGMPVRNTDDIEQLLKNKFVLLKNGQHFKQLDLIYCKCDLFITTPECWGVIFLIRTGSVDFSHKMVTPKQQGGFMPSFLRVKDGRLWNGKTVLETPQETDVFDIYEMKFIPPENRNI